MGGNDPPDKAKSKRNLKEERRKWREIQLKRSARMRSEAQVMKHQKCAAWIQNLVRKRVQLPSIWFDNTTSVTRPVSPLDRPGCAATPNASQGELSESSLGEQIPSELFAIILFYVGESCTSYNSRGTQESKYLRRQSAEWAGNNSRATTLQACSLVCHYWAVQCRRPLFFGATLIISTSEDMETFKQYVTQGCHSLRLQPIHRLIGGIFIVQAYNDTQSFCHRLHALIPLIGKNLFKELFLVGPIPDYLPRFQLGTPHWSIPSTIVTPLSLLPFHSTNVMNIRLPSFRHVSRYVRHLSSAAYIRLEKLTWDRGAALEHVIPRSYGIRRHGRDHLSISARNCTDNMQICLHTALMRPDCPLHALQEDEYHRVVWLISQLWQLRNDTHTLNHMVHWDQRNCISIGLHSEQECLFTFQLLFDNLILGSPTPNINLSGFRAMFYVFEARIDIHAVIKLLINYPTLRVIHVDFVNSSHAEETAAVLRWSELIAPQAPLQDCEFVLTPIVRDLSDFEPHRAIRDPLILDPTGRDWADIEDIVPYLLEYPRSQHAIQRACERRINFQREEEKKREERRQREEEEKREEVAGRPK
ncbi:hypothetical protein BC629DRAFT_940007 [Irpex lacteus]|nr:hypothetical protein BC629DRAFT_940007 [Irpex lacteus]